MLIHTTLMFDALTPKWFLDIEMGENIMSLAPPSEGGGITKYHGLIDEYGYSQICVKYMYSLSFTYPFSWPHFNLSLNFVTFMYLQLSLWNWLGLTLDLQWINRLTLITKLTKKNTGPEDLGVFHKDSKLNLSLSWTWQLWKAVSIF